MKNVSITIGPVDLKTGLHAKIWFSSTKIPALANLSRQQWQVGEATNVPLLALIQHAKGTARATNNIQMVTRVRRAVLGVVAIILLW